MARVRRDVDARGEAGTLRLESLTKRFGDFTAVDALDLTVPAGAFFALLGPSGCGKTTTLRMVAGLEQPTSGRVLLGDDDVTARPAYQRPVNTVFQSYALFPHLDVTENVAFGLRRRGVRDVGREVEQALELVQLGGFGRRRPAELSGGQQQRVALARALVNRPRVLLLDEPMGALDLKLRRQMQLEIKRIQVETGITFVHVTHDQEEAMTMADTIAVMNHGRVEQLGDPVALYESPATTFVANFLGQSNLLRARVVSRDRDVLLDCHGHRLALPAERVSGRGDDVWVGVRPEKINLARAGEQPVVQGGNTLHGVVVDASFVGVSTQYTVRLPWEQDVVVFVQNLRRGSVARRGDAVVLQWDPAHSFALEAGQDAGTGVDEEPDASTGEPVAAGR